jgi:hypothetical protein
MTEQQEKDADCLFIGYFTIWTRIEHPEFTRAQVLERFEGMSDYMKAQELNLTHLRNGFFEYQLKPVLPADIIREIARWRKNGTVLQEIRVWEFDKRPLTVAYEDIKSALTDEKITRVTDVTHYNIFDYIYLRMGAKEFIDELTSPKDDNKLHFVEPQKYEKSLSLEDACAVIMHVSAAGAMRFERTHCVDEQDLNGKTKLLAFPLVAGNSGELPDTIRQTPLPMPNADMDPNVQFSVLQAKKFVEHVYLKDSYTVDNEDVSVVPEDRPAPFSTDRASLKWNHSTSKINRNILSEVIFMLAVSRLTGNTQVLSRYTGLQVGRDQEDVCIHLPVMSQWEDFGFFLEAVKLHPSYNSVLSQQHAASVPTEIQTTKRMCMLITALATSTNGCRKVASFVAAGGRKRADVIDCLVNCIAECGDLQGGHGDLGFLCGKIIADLETVFLDILPPLTVESLILGYGAGNGVDCLIIPGMEDDTSENRALYLFEWLEAHLNKEENISLALACGWEVTDGQLRSIWSG